MLHRLNSPKYYDFTFAVQVVGRKRAPKEHVNRLSILHFGSKAQDRGVARNPCFQDPCVNVLGACHPVFIWGELHKGS